MCADTAVSLAFLVFLVLLPIACKLAGMVAAHGASLAFRVPPSCRVGQPASLGIDVRRRGLPLLQHIELTVTCRNVLLDEVVEIPVVLDVSPRMRRFDVPLDTAACGRVELSVDGARSFDPLGLSCERIACSLSGSYTVYPALADLVAPLERAPQACFAGSSYDPHRKGQDMSETFDIRDYRDADAPHAIHWKLSSKVDKLVVREASHPSNYEVLVLVDVGRTVPGSAERVPVETVSAALGLAASISYDLCRQNLGHNVACAADGRMVDAAVDSPDSFGTMLDLVTGVRLPLVPGEVARLFDSYCRERSFTKTVLVTSALDELAFAVMGGLTDLSVLFVGPDGAESAEDAGAYRLTRIPAEAVADRVRSVSL